VAVIQVLVGDLLSELGYELSDVPLGLAVRLEAGWRRADAALRRGLRRIRIRTGRLRRRVGGGSGSRPQAPPLE
jgi:hypothetical protein